MYSVMLLPMADGNTGICPAKCGEDGPWLPCGLYSHGSVSMYFFRNRRT